MPGKGIRNGAGPPMRTSAVEPNAAGEKPGDELAPLLRYVFGLLVLTAAVALRVILAPWLGQTLSHPTIFLAVLLTAWYFGLGPALVNIVLGYLAIEYFILPPRPEGLARLAATVGLYLLLNSIILLFVRRLRLERERLATAQAALQRLKDELEVRVELRTAELAAANQELEAFTYSVSHDLRAPLRHVVSFVELLGKHLHDRADDKTSHYLRIISQSAKRMATLIEDLLTLSRIGRAQLAETDVDLGNLVEEARQVLAPEAAERPVEWRIEPLPHVRGDRTLLRSAMVNLLSNALKYTRSRSPARIEVGGSERDGKVTCYVRDNGAGFDMRFADKLFGVFQRLHKAEEFEGTGIGLASVRRIIGRHGGKTWAEGAPDQGATFYFSLPTGAI